jgi:hypothetical protein
MRKTLIIAAAMAAICGGGPAMAGDAEMSDQSICDHVFTGGSRENTAVRTWCKEGAIGGRYALFFSAIRRGWTDESPSTSSMDPNYCGENRTKLGGNDPFQSCSTAWMARATAARKAEEYRQEQSFEADIQARNHEIAAAKENAATRTAHDNENGYKRIAIADVLLDGKTLAADNQKVSLIGTYIHEVKTDWLFPGNMWPSNRDESNGISLIKDSATREFRSLLLSAWNRADRERGLTGVVILGHVSMCERATLVGVEQMPCVIIEDGWR